MTLAQIIGLNVKWYRYQNKMTQEQYAQKTKFKMAYISIIETGNTNLTCRNIEVLAKSFHINPNLLLNEETAKLAMKLPTRLDMYKQKQ